MALILVPCLSAIKAIRMGYMELIAPAIGTVLIWKAGVSPVYIVLAGIVGGLVYTLWLKDVYDLLATDMCLSENWSIWFWRWICNALSYSV